MPTSDTLLEKLATQASEMNLRASSDPEGLALTWERSAIADLLHNQLEIIKAINAIDSTLLKDIRSK